MPTPNATPAKPQQPKTRQPRASTLSKPEIVTLTTLVAQAISAGRKSDMPDEELSSLYTLRSKLVKIGETRNDER
jgi:hypothetical protein